MTSAGKKDIGVPKKILFKSYDYADLPSGPGQGLYHGKMDKYKSVKDFLNKARKRRKPKLAAWQDLSKLSDQFRKDAIFNSFIIDESTYLPNTVNLARKLGQSLQRMGWLAGANIELVNQNFFDLIKDLFNHYVYRPTWNSDVNINDEKYYSFDDVIMYYPENTIEPFFHDLVHELLDPGISHTFEDPEQGNFSEEGDPLYDLNTFISEHESAYLGTAGEKEYINYGLSSFIDNNFYQAAEEIFDQTSDPKERKTALLEYLKDQIAQMTPDRQSISQYLLLKSFQKITYENEYFKSQQPGQLANDLNTEVEQKFKQSLKKSLSQPLISDQKLAAGNRLRLFFKIMDQLIDSDKFSDLLEQRVEHAA